MTGWRSFLAGLALQLAAAASARAQTPPTAEPHADAPVYRGGTYVVPISLTLNYRRKPWTGLTTAEIHVTLDKREFTPLEVQHDEVAPNRYTIYLQPPDTARDGRKHTLQIRVKKPDGKWTTLPAKMPLTLGASRDRAGVRPIE